MPPVDQLKYPTNGKGDSWILETIAGMVDEDESFEEAIRREVREEIGYELRALQHIATPYRRCRLMRRQCPAARE